MKFETYQEAHDKAVAHLQKGEFAEAMGIFDAARPAFPGDRTDIDYFRSCLAVRLDNVPLTYKILDDLLADGIWFSEDILRMSPSYAPLQGKDEFEKRVEEHKTARIESGNDPAGTLHIRGGQQSEAVPLAFVLHGNGSSAQAELEHWQAAVEDGWLVAAPGSKSVFWEGGVAFWPDHETARPQIEKHLAAIHRQYKVDKNRFILAGFSMGGDIALAEALKGEAARPAGFILVGPGGQMFDEPSSFAPLIEGAQGSGLRGIVLVSETDGAIQGDKIKEVVKMLNDGGIRVRFEVYPDEGHVYPSDFGKRLPDLFAWIFKDS